jgi:hypothetical protein
MLAQNAHRKIMKKNLFLFAFMLTGITAFAQLPAGFNKKGTMFRDVNVTAGFKYFLLDPATMPEHTTVNKVTFQKTLLTRPKLTNLTVEVYNILFNNDALAVFSVMPSLFVKNPSWKKINIDTVKAQIITLSGLQDTIRNKFANYPIQDRGITDPLKYYNYILIIKKADGYYFNTTDCITEFFQIAKTGDDKPAPFKINPNAEMLSIAEYESGYRRKHGEYSSNFSMSENSYFNDDVKSGPLLNMSYIIDDKGEKAYKFWLLDQWIVHNSNYRRGMDRFIFKPGVGVIGASYDFYMNGITSYWYHENKAPHKVIKDSKTDKTLYNITPYSYKYNSAFLDYLDEGVIKYTHIIKL